MIQVFIFITDVDQRDSAGLTPLLWSAANGQRPAYELLLQYGTCTRVRGRKVLQIEYLKTR